MRDALSEGALPHLGNAQHAVILRCSAEAESTALGKAIFPQEMLPCVRYAISSGAEPLLASRLATSRSFPLSTRQTSSL